MAGNTSCSRAANAIAREGPLCLVSPRPHLVFSARRVEKLRARLDWGAYGTVPIKPRGMHERTYQRILRVLPITRPCERRGRVMLESTNHESTLPIYGGNAEIDLLSLAVGQFGGADNFR